MITLNLLHPVELTPVQTWNFAAEPLIRIGRSNDNHVVLLSSVVSRHHLELHRHPLYWEAVSLGTNGTYVDDTPIERERITDGIVIRLASTGPRIQVRLDAAEMVAKHKKEEASAK